MISIEKSISLQFLLCKFRSLSVIQKIFLILVSVPVLFLLSAFIHSFFNAGLIESEPSLLFVDRHHRFVAELEQETENFGYWPLPDTIPHKTTTCLKAGEDHRFDSHYGIDLRAVARAFRDNYILKNSFSGASTIAMQTARMQNSHARNWFFKISEAFSALWLTLFHGREAVIRQYLRIAPYGNRIRGINYAARRYFKKPLIDLSWAETALLTALPNSPGTMNLYRTRGMSKAKARAETILKRVFEYGWMDTTELRFSLKELGYIGPQHKELRHDNLLHAVLAAEKHFKRNRDKISLDPYNPTLRLAMDLDIQNKVHEIALEHMEELRRFYAGNLSMIVLSVENGEILAYLGSEAYYDFKNRGKIDYNRTMRSTGSIIKPFIYAFGMEWKGYTPATLLTDIGLSFSGEKSTFTPANYDNEYLGPVLYKTALGNSRNIPAVQVLQDIGLKPAYRKLTALGLTQDDGDAEYYGLGLAVGNLYCSLFDLCDAYLSLANKGEDLSAKWLYQGDKEGREKGRIIQKDAALQIQRILSDPQARVPSFPRLGFLEYPFPVAVKTGTSRGYRDAWTIGWSDKYLVGVWIGRHDNQSMKELSGYGAAAPVVKSIFSELHKECMQGLNDTKFPPPKGYKPVKINRLTGELASDSVPYTTTVYFNPGTEPTTYGKMYEWVPIDKRNGLRAPPSCPDSCVEVERFISLPPIFKDWAVSEGLPVPPIEYSPLCAGVSREEDYSVEVTSPGHNSRIYIDPEMPEKHNSLFLNCMVKPRVKEVLWIVDGKEFSVTEYPYKVPWELEPGEHTIKAKIPYTDIESKSVRFDVY